MEKGSKTEILSQVDWDKCVLCQTVMTDKLRCPLDSMQNEAKSWNDSFCRSIQKSCELGCMPFETPLLTLDLKREELSQLFRDNQAK